MVNATIVEEEIIMKLEYAGERARQLMDEHNLSDWSLEFSSRLTHSYGYCNSKNKKIVISKPITKKECNQERFESVVFHEIAHVLAYLKYGKSVNHGSRWKKIFESLGGKDMPYEPPFKPFKYIMRCPICHREVFRRRKGNFACGGCCRKYNGGKYDVKYKMIFYTVEYDKETDTYTILNRCE